jgi:hypothetical protein
LRAWASLPVGPDGRAAGRTVVFLAGFDERGRPRLFRFDSEDQPTFQSREVPLFDRNRQMEIAAIATTGALDPNVSSLIVERLEQVERQAPAIGRQRQFVTAFNDVKAELASSHAHVGGQTFVTTVAPATAP